MSDSIESYPGQAFDEKQNSIPGTWRFEALNDYGQAEDTEDGPQVEEQHTESTQSMKSGEDFWRTVLEIPDGVGLELSARQKILGSFFRLPNKTDEYSGMRSKYATHTPGRVSVFGLEVPIDFEKTGDRVKVYPFNDSVRGKIHQSVVADLEKEARQKGASEEQFWEREVAYWMTPLRQSVYERNYGRAKAKVEDEINEYWQEKTKDFKGNPIDPDWTPKQKTKFHEYLVSEQILTKDEIDFVEHFPETQKKFAQRITGELVAPIMPEYAEFMQYYEDVTKEYTKAVKLYNSREPRETISPFPNQGSLGVQTKYRTRLARQKQLLDQYREQLTEYMEYAKSVPLKRKLKNPPSLPRSIPAPTGLIDYRVRCELRDISRHEQRKYIDSYSKESDFKYRETVARKLRHGGKKVPMSPDAFIDDRMAALEVSKATNRDEIRGSFTEFEEALRRFNHLQVIYTQAETLWGPAPIEVRRDCRGFQEQARQELEDEQPAELERSRKEALRIEVNLAANLGLIPSSESESTQIIALPTGMVATLPGQPTRSLAISPLDKRILEALPNEYRSNWKQIWQTYESQSNKNDRVNNSRVAHAAERLVEERLRADTQNEELPELKLVDLQGRYHFITDRFIDRNTGDINPQLDAAEVATVAKIMPYFGNFVYAVKKPRIGQKVSLKAVQDEITEHLSGVRPRTPGLLFKGGVLNISSLRQLVEQDKPGAELTINLLANCIGSFLYSGLKTNEQRSFEEMVSDQVDVPKKSFFQAFGIMVENPLQRRELMKRVMFVSYFGQYVVGKAPKPFNELMKGMITEKNDGAES